MGNSVERSTEIGQLGVVLNFLRKKASRESYALGPEHVRLYAIGDVHGCLSELQILLNRIQEDIASRPPKQNKIVFLGDLIDRGPDSCGVLNFLMDYSLKDADIEFLIGNHEAMTIEVWDGAQEIAKRWMSYGGESLLESYGVATGDLWALGDTALIQRIQSIIPKRHIEFMRGFKTHLEFGDYLLVHAGIDPTQPLSEQTLEDVVWSREPFLSWTGPLEKRVVHGHTISGQPEERPHRIGIDTGAYQSGRLSALRIEGSETSFLSNLDG